MTIQELKKRRQLCIEKDLCFVSLRPFEAGDAAVLVRHPELGENVLVFPEYVKTLEKPDGRHTIGDAEVLREG